MQIGVNIHQVLIRNDPGRVWRHLTGGMPDIGGKGGEGKALPYFMVRIRVPNGLLRTSQLRTIAEVTQRYARGTVDLTVRQNVQLHWVTVERSRRCWTGSGARD